MFISRYLILNEFIAPYKAVFCQYLMMKLLNVSD